MAWSMPPYEHKIRAARRESFRAPSKDSCRPAGIFLARRPKIHATWHESHTFLCNMPRALVQAKLPAAPGNGQLRQARQLCKKFRMLPSGFRMFLQQMPQIFRDILHLLFKRDGRGAFLRTR